MESFFVLYFTRFPGRWTFAKDEQETKKNKENEQAVRSVIRSKWLRQSRRLELYISLRVRLKIIVTSHRHVYLLLSWKEEIEWSRKLLKLEILEPFRRTCIHERHQLTSSIPFSWLWDLEFVSQPQYEFGYFCKATMQFRLDG